MEGKKIGHCPPRTDVFKGNLGGHRDGFPTECNKGGASLHPPTFSLLKTHPLQAPQRSMCPGDGLQSALGAPTGGVVLVTTSAESQQLQTL